SARSRPRTVPQDPFPQTRRRSGNAQARGPELEARPAALVTRASRPAGGGRAKLARVHYRRLQASAGREGAVPEQGAGVGRQTDLLSGEVLLFPNIAEFG